MILKELLAAVVEPHMPVVWVDDQLPDEIWSRLADGLRERGYRILDLGGAGRIGSYGQLMEAFGHAAGWPVETCPNMNALKDSLLALDDPASGGWVVLFRDAGRLRQADEAAYEELLEVLETVHEIKLEKKHLVFKLVVSG